MKNMVDDWNGRTDDLVADHKYGIFRILRLQISAVAPPRTAIRLEGKKRRKESDLQGVIRDAFTDRHHSHRGLVENGKGGTECTNDIQLCTPSKQRKLVALQKSKLMKRTDGHLTIKVVQLKRASPSGKHMPRLNRSATFPPRPSPGREMGRTWRQGWG